MPRKCIGEPQSILHAETDLCALRQILCLEINFVKISLLKYCTIFLSKKIKKLEYN